MASVRILNTPSSYQRSLLPDYRNRSLLYTYSEILPNSYTYYRIEFDWLTYSIGVIRTLSPNRIRLVDCLAVGCIKLLLDPDTIVFRLPSRTVIGTTHKKHNDQPFKSH